MISKVAAKKETLRNKIIELAEMKIATGGLLALRARDLATEAGCALGSLYNMFADLDDLILHVNARTLMAIDAQMAKAAGETAAEQLHQLAQIYLNFARQSPLLWRALFDHHLPDDYQLPDWYAQKLLQLMSRIIAPLAALQPTISHTELITRSRTLFAAVHGVISISLDNRFIGIAQTDLAVELHRFVAVMLAGAAHTRNEQ